jgi:hypothetical protein
MLRSSDDGLAIGLKLVTYKKACICIVEDCLLNVYIAKAQRDVSPKDKE